MSVTYAASLRRRDYGAGFRIDDDAPYVKLDFIEGYYRVAGDGWATLTDVPGATVARTGAGVARNQAGELVSFATGIPRITDKGLLIEGQRTNLLLRSGDLSHAAWTKSNTTAASNGDVSPLGVASTRISETGTGTTTYSVLQAVSATQQPYTATVIMKAQGRTWVVVYFYSNGSTANSAYAYVNLQTGALGTSSIFGLFTARSARVTTLANGFVQLELTATPDAAVTNLSVRIYSATANGGSTSITGLGDAAFDVAAAQIEAGGFGSSYIATTSASATRGADSVIFGALIVGSEASLLAEFELSGADSSALPGERVAAALSDGTADNRCVICNLAGAQGGLTVVSGVTAGSVGQGSTGAVGGVETLAYAFDQDDFRMSRNGILGTPDTSGAAPTGLTQLAVGSSLASAGHLFGFVRRVWVARRAYQNAELQGWQS